jgi:hypothetical protein
MRGWAGDVPLEEAARALVEEPNHTVREAKEELLRTVLDARAPLLVPGAVEQGGSVTFPVVFPAFRKWTTIRFVDPVNKIDATVKNYAGMLRHLGRYRKAQDLADARDARLAKLHKPTKPPDRPRPKPPVKPTPKPPRPESRWIRIGTVRNEIAKDQFGIKITNRDLLKKYTVRHFYVRIADQTIATLRPLGGGGVAVVETPTRTPLRGGAVFVRRDELRKR